ncbi:MAG: hypothetical protein JWM59_1202 [Verrucomicrobiales bacterium]|nr:hypothetical protein [Verrucomicrobiales bacterium]
MKCPRCIQPVAPAEESCRRCGYSLEVPDAQLGHGAVSVERLTDADGIFTQAERLSIRAVQQEFERRFPQLFLMVFAGALPAPASPRQFGFWLLNHAAIPDMDVLRPNECGLVLVVDPEAGAAGLTVGYFLESYLGQDELGGVLEAGRKAFAQGRYVTAVREVTRSLTRRLIQRTREAARDPAAFAPPAPPDARPFPAVKQLGEPVPLPKPAPATKPDGGGLVGNLGRRRDKG